jgi:D-alanine-D-alanine ligase
LDPRTPDWVLPAKTDVVFLALHGTYGEDGTVQKQLDELGVPYTGCDAEASRIAFDKVLTKQSCIQVRRADGEICDGRNLGAESSDFPENLRLPLVVKPVAAGFERRSAICRARRGLAKCAGGGVEI